MVVECQAEILPLLCGCAGVDQWIAVGKPLPPFDVQSPLVSLPNALGITLQTVPAQVPYIPSEKERVARWRTELASIPGFKIGIAWQGNRNYGKDKARSIPLDRFAPLMRVPGVKFLSLQKGDGTEQLAAVSSWGIKELGSRLDLDGAFLDTAAVMANLDLVITSDTAIPHLAGAVGVPTWMALSYAAEWRWLRIDKTVRGIRPCDCFVKRSCATGMASLSVWRWSWRPSGRSNHAKNDDASVSKTAKVSY